MISKKGKNITILQVSRSGKHTTKMSLNNLKSFHFLQKSTTRSSVSSKGKKDVFNLSGCREIQKFFRSMEGSMDTRQSMECYDDEMMKREF